MVAVSVMICSHNPRADYLDRVLQALRAQTLPHREWELLLVDNASAQPLAGRWDLGWHAAARHIRENQLGLAPARLRGMVEAKGELLVFVDDDNVLTSNFLTEALRIGREWPMLGIWGGSMIPEFEVEPPSHLRPFFNGVAIVEVKSPRWSNVAACPGLGVNGGGMCLRSNVAAAYRQYYDASDIRLTDRSGADLISGGDVEICHVACSVGLGIGMFPDLELTHLIPRHRIEEEYLIRLCEGIWTSLHIVGFKWEGIAPKSPYLGVELLRFAKHVMLRRRLDRRLFLARCRALQRARTMIRERPSARRSA